MEFRPQRPKKPSLPIPSNPAPLPPKVQDNVAHIRRASSPQLPVRNFYAPPPSTPAPLPPGTTKSMSMASPTYNERKKPKDKELDGFTKVWLTLKSGFFDSKY